MKVAPTRQRCLSFVVVLLFPVLDAAIVVPRRRAIRDTGDALVAIVTTMSGALLGQPQSAQAAAAARGAAELDFEFYIRDLVGGNKREGTVSASPAPPLPPPRALQNPLRSLLLNDSCSQDCLSTLALIEEVRFARTEGGDPRRIEREIQQSMEQYREKVKPSFYAKAPWNQESVADQYYFDLTSYALWRTAADLLPNYANREKFVRRLGRYIYQNGQQAGLLHAKPAPLQYGRLVGTQESVAEILSMFRDSGVCQGYRLGELVKSKEDERPFLFDELDDEAIASGASVDCLVSVLEPATLGASLQITGEQSRFSPDFVGPTLAAMWEAVGIQSSWETFFVDPEYRPNPKDYFPNEQLLQYTLTLAAQSSN